MNDKEIEKVAFDLVKKGYLKVKYENGKPLFGVTEKGLKVGLKGKRK